MRPARHRLEHLAPDDNPRVRPPVSVAVLAASQHERRRITPASEHRGKGDGLRETSGAQHAPGALYGA